MVRYIPKVGENQQSNQIHTGHFSLDHEVTACLDTLLITYTQLNSHSPFLMQRNEGKNKTKRKTKNVFEKNNVKYLRN